MRRLILAAAFAILCALPGAAQKQPAEPANTRSVQGVVTAADEAAVDGAVVQLKNLKTLQIRSFITKEGGAYAFQGLSTDVDYELKAEHQGSASAARTLSTFDSRKKAVINLKLNKK